MKLSKLAFCWSVGALHVTLILVLDSPYMLPALASNMQTLVSAAPQNDCSFVGEKASRIIRFMLFFSDIGPITVTIRDRLGTALVAVHMT